MSVRSKAGGKQLAPVVMHPKGIRAIWRLLTDRKAPAWPKLLFLFALAYVVMPLDLIPDMAPIITWLDDMGVVALSMGWIARAAARYAEASALEASTQTEDRKPEGRAASQRRA